MRRVRVSTIRLDVGCSSVLFSRFCKTVCMCGYFMQAFVCVIVCVCTFLYDCACLCMCVCRCVCVCMCVCVRVCAHLSVFV